MVWFKLSILESEQNDIIARTNVDSQIIDVAWSMDKIVVLDETNGLHVFSNNGEKVWTSESDAGGAELVVENRFLPLMEPEHCVNSP